MATFSRFFCTTSSDMMTWMLDMSCTLFLRCFEYGEYCRPEIPWFFKFSGSYAIILCVSSKTMFPEWKSFIFCWRHYFSGENVKPVIPLLCRFGSSSFPLNLSYRYWLEYSHLVESNFYVSLIALVLLAVKTFFVYCCWFAFLTLLLLVSNADLKSSSVGLICMKLVDWFVLLKNSLVL